MRTWRAWGVLLGLLVLGAAGRALGHCQVPCGIYNDEMRIMLIEEHITTIEKSMKQIKTLSGDGERNHNQLVRWIAAKEEHADMIQQLVCQYFLTQRIVAVPEGGAEYARYQDQLKTLHQMLVYAMKCKQTADLENASRLRGLVQSFKVLYFGK